MPSSRAAVLAKLRAAGVTPADLETIGAVPDDECRAVIEAKEALRCRGDFGFWLTKASPPPWRWDWPHLAYVRRHLDDVTAGRTKRLMISMAPQHGKSEQVTIRYPVWRLEQNPALRVGIGCYNLDHAMEFSRKMRRLATDRNVRLAKDSQAAEKWETQSGGGVRAVGVGTGITGKPLDLLVIDDACKSRKEAESESYRQAVKDWYSNDLYTRLQHDAPVILIQTRWHTDDLPGSILSGPDAASWTVINLPAEAEEGDPLGRRPGEPLCHAEGTMIYDGGEWMRVENHPSFTDYRRGPGVAVYVSSLTAAEVVTPEHLYWARQESRWDGTYDEKCRPTHNTTKATLPGWVEARHLGRNHWVGLPIDMTETEPQPIPTLVYDRGGGGKPPKTAWRTEPRELAELNDREWWWFLGLWWGDGSLWGGISVVTSDDGIEGRVTALLDRYGRKWKRREQVGCRSITFEHATLGRWLRTDWRVGVSRKAPPGWVETLRLEYQAQLLRGYFDADGSASDRSIRLSSIHLPGLKSVRRMLARHGIPASIYRAKSGGSQTILGREVTTQDGYELNARDGVEALGFAGYERQKLPAGAFIADGHLWSRVKALEPLPAGEWRFCPITTATETYRTDFGLSHNCPERFTAADLADRKRVLGSYGYNSLYQGRPVPRGGGMVKEVWLKKVLDAPAGLSFVRFWDKAATEDGGDWTAGVLMGRSEHGVYYVADVVRGRWSAGRREQVIRATAESDSLRYGFVRVVVEQEGGSGGKESAAATVRNLAGFSVRAERPTGDKAVRLEPFAAQAEAGNVRVVQGAWNADYVDELTAFPAGKHDDQCLPAGTLVLTAGGWARIENIRAGAEVLTRGGYRKVRWSGQTSPAAATVAIECDNGCVLECTAGHPVSVVGAGWVAACRIRPGDRVVSWQPSKPSNGAAEPGGDTRTRNGGTTASTSSATPRTGGHPSGCTAKSGRRLTARFLTAVTSITGTITRSITSWATWSASRLWSTGGGTRCGLRTNGGHTWTPSGLRPPSGTNPPKAGRGTANTPDPSDGRWLTSSAGTAASPTEVATAGASSAQRSAGNRPAGHERRSTHSPASSAGNLSTLRSRASVFAATRVVGLRDGRRGVPVYNLKVEGNPEFVANGVLVHNCDATSGAFNKLATFVSKYETEELLVV